MINYIEYRPGPAVPSSRQKSVKDEFAFRPAALLGGHAALLPFAIRYNNVLIIIIMETISERFTPCGQLTATAIRAIFINDTEENIFNIFLPQYFHVFIIVELLLADGGSAVFAPSHSLFCCLATFPRHKLLNSPLDHHYYAT